jgi:hypothetical protein
VVHRDRHLVIEMASRRARVEGVVSAASAAARAQNPRNNQLINELDQVQTMLRGLAEDEAALNIGYSDRTRAEVDQDVTNMIRVLEAVGAHHHIHDFDDLGSRVDRPAELVQAAINSSGGIVPFLHSMAAGRAVGRVDRAMFYQVFNDTSGSEMIGNSTPRDWLKATFRAVRPGTHEWIPTSMIDHVVSRAAQASDLVEGAKWIDLQNNLRTETQWVIFKPSYGYPLALNGTPYTILQGHVGALVFQGRDQTRGTDGFHNDLRAAYHQQATIGPYIDALKVVFRTWVWRGNDEPLVPPAHPDLVWNGLSLAIAGNQSSMARGQKQAFDRTLAEFDRLNT